MSSRHIDLQNVAYLILSTRSCVSRNHAYVYVHRPTSIQKQYTRTLNSESSLKVEISFRVDIVYVSFGGPCIAPPRSIVWSFLAISPIIMYLIDKNQRRLIGVGYDGYYRYNTKNSPSTKTKIHT